jgi:hypothetical protein
VRKVDQLEPVIVATRTRNRRHQNSVTDHRAIGRPISPIGRRCLRWFQRDVLAPDG